MKIYVHGPNNLNVLSYPGAYPMAQSVNVLAWRPVFSPEHTPDINVETDAHNTYRCDKPTVFHGHRPLDKASPMPWEGRFVRNLTTM
jgi:hypothetical protein